MKKLVVFLIFFGIQTSVFTQVCNISEGIEEVRIQASKGDFNGALKLVSKLQTCPSIEEEQSFDLLIWEYKLHRNKLKNKKAEEALLKALALLTRSHMQSDLDFELLLLEHYALRGKRHEFETLN
ncbi:MAG: hypothetical protein DWP94_13905, partial [Flavobacterium sp.]